MGFCDLPTINPENGTIPGLNGLHGVILVTALKDPLYAD
jgi:hypothetical protein